MLRSHCWVAVLVSFGIATTSAGAAETDTGTVSCELQVTEGDDAVVLRGVALSNKNVVGTYELHLDKVGQNGSANINQGGQFNAQAGIPEELSSVTLDASGTDYIAKLKIVSGGRTIECSKRIQGSL